MNLIRVIPAEGMQSHLKTKSSSNPVEDFILRAVIFANGSITRPANISPQLEEDDLIIAADGGAHHCQELGIIPAVLIGDMDSVQPELITFLKTQGTQLIVYPRDKDQIDLELALNYAEQQGAQEVLLFGLLGGRLDLSMANLMLLARDEWQKMSIVVSDGHDTAYIMHDNESISLHGNPGDIVSLIPFTDHVSDVSTRGLRWPLVKSNLALGNTISISNEMLDRSASIEIGSGKLLLVHHAIPAVEGED
jgi:thiamine pyrophosphokinase